MMTLYPSVTSHMFPVSKRKTSSVSNTCKTLWIATIFLHTTLHILPISILKAHCDILKTTPLPTRLFRSPIQPYRELEVAEFSVPPRTVKSNHALDFQLTHYLTPLKCVLQKSQRYLKYCARQPPRRQRATAGRCGIFLPRVLTQLALGFAPPRHGKYQALLTHVKHFQSTWFSLHITLHIILISILKAHCCRLKTTPLPTRLFRSQIQGWRT